MALELPEIELSTVELAAIIGKSTTTIREFVSAGMPKVRQNTFSLEAVRWLFEFERQKAARKPGRSDLLQEKTLLTAAQRKLEELKVEQAEGKLLPASTVEGFISRSYSAFRNRMLSIPTKCAARVFGCKDTNEIKKILEDAVYEALNEIRITIEAIKISEAGRTLGDSAPAAAHRKRVGGPRKKALAGIERGAGAVVDRPGGVPEGDHGRDERPDGGTGDGDVILPSREN